jgi:small subunit ribosomal protein S16
MATTIRLQRQGKKKAAIYHVVIADSRSARNGKFIEKLGTFNPNVNPPAVNLDFDRALYWTKTGAEPSDAVRTILSTAGVLMKKHLDGGVTKGALTQEQADAKFTAWLEGKNSTNDKTAKSLSSAKAEAKKKALEAEKAVNTAKAQAIAAKLAAAEAPAATEEVTANEEVAAEATPETPAAEAEAPAAE